jgi:hypothetical protein
MAYRVLGEASATRGRPARYPALLPGVAAFLAVAFFTAVAGGGAAASRASRSVRSRAIFSCTARLSARYSAIAFSPSRSRSAFLNAALARAWSFVCLEANSNLLSMSSIAAPPWMGPHDGPLML